MRTSGGPAADPIRDDVRRFFDENHEGIERARRARRYFYGYLTRVIQARVPPGLRVLDIGCGAGHLLAALKPSAGVGIDLSPRAVETARRAHPGPSLRFIEGDGTDPQTLADAGGPFDVVMMFNVLTHLSDVQQAFENLQPRCHSRTRVLVYSYSRVWQPALRAAELLGLKLRQPAESWLPSEEIEHMLSNLIRSRQS